MIWTTTNKCPQCQGSLPWPPRSGVDDCVCPHCGASFKFASGTYGMLLKALEPLMQKHGGCLPSDVVPDLAEQVRAWDLAPTDQHAKEMLNRLSVAELLKVRLERK